MGLPTVDQVVKDPEFLQLPMEEQKKVIAHLDNSFTNLPPQEQDKAVFKLTGRTPQAYPGGHMLDHPVSREEARRIAGEEVVKKARADGDTSIVTGAEIGHPEALFATPTGILPQIVSNTRQALKGVPLVGLASEGLFKGTEEGAKALAPAQTKENVEMVGREAMDKNFPVSNVVGGTLGQIPTAFVGGTQAAGLKGLKLIKEGVKAGGLFGGEGAAQANIQENGLPLTAEKAENLATDTAVGTGTGMILGGGIPVAGMALRKVGGIFGKIPSLLESRTANVAREEAKSSAINTLEKEAADAVTKKPTTPVENPTETGTASPETAATTSEPPHLKTTPEEVEVPDAKFMPSDAREEAKRVAQVKATVRRAAENGVPNEHASDLIKMNDHERAIASDLVKAGEMRAVGDPHAPSPEEIQGMVGEEIRRPIIALGELKQRAGQELGELFDKIPDTPVHNLPVGKRPVDLVITELQKVEGLKGLKINEDGTLDFSRTTMKGQDNEGARKTLEAYLEQIKGETPFQLHLTRQELFEVLGGKKLAQVQLNASEEKAVDAVRRGLSKFLETNVKGYSAANQKYAKIMEPLKTLNRVFKYGNLEDAMAPNQDILDEGAGVIARRLTSNIKSKIEIKDALEQINGILKENNIANDVRPEKIQEAYNIVASHYPEIVPKTSFQNLVKEGVKTGMPEVKGRTLTEMAVEGVKSVGKDLLPVHQTDATRQKALQDLIEALGVNHAPRGPIQLPPARAPAVPKSNLTGTTGDQFLP